VSVASLSGKTAMVVGSSPGINAGIAEELARRGAAIACVDRNPEYAQACATWLIGKGAKAIALSADVTDDDAVHRTVLDARERLGGIDILVNGAAIETWQSALEMSVEDFRRHLDVIVTGTFAMSRRTAEVMIGRQRGGAIINLASTEAHQGRPGNVGYGTAKAAVLHLTKVLAMEFAQYGIRVNSLTPTGTDPVEGDLRRAEWGVEWSPAVAPRRPDFSRGDEGIPLGHRPCPSDYGRAAAFLASDDANMVTGIDLRVDGGVVSRYWRWSPVSSGEATRLHRNGGGAQ
jgi:NAD(P)-dependent dehydrogenase (short-subunit alcohol dehydrogenase family)